MKTYNLEGIADVYSASQIKELGIVRETGLGKVNKKSVYETVNDLLINEINKGIIPWRKPWTVGKGEFTNGSFANYRTKTPYKGINPWLISIKLKPHHAPFFMTKAQIEKRGGTLKSDAVRFQVVYFGSAIQSKFFEPTPEKPEGETLSRIIRFLKEYIVYNIADTDLNIDWQKEKPEPTEEQKIENCEKVYEMYPAPKPTLKNGGNEAFYRQSQDLVQMPPKASFKKLPEYYCTLFHELIHSTGHGKRLKREKGIVFGDKKYAYEELIAEIGATYICAHTGILFHSKKNSVAYLQSWMKALAKEAKDNKTFFFKAASQSQKAANFILSKQLAAKKKKPKKALAGTKKVSQKSTNIKTLKAHVAKLQDLGKLIKVRRKFEPYTLTDHVAEFLLGRRIKKESFIRYGDKKHLTGKSGNLYRLHWLGNKGITKEIALDVLANDFIDQYFEFSGRDTDEIIQEMVEIITNYPTGSGAYMDDRIRAIKYDEERFNERNEEEMNKDKKLKTVVKTSVKKVSTKKSTAKKSKIKKIAIKKVAVKKVKAKKTVDKKEVNKSAPIATRKVYSTELNIIKNFLALDAKVVAQDSLANFSARIKKAKANQQISAYKTIISEIGTKVHKALGFALESPENKITVNLEKDFKASCQQILKSAQVKVRTEYLAGSKVSLNGVPENIRTQLGKMAFKLLGAYDLYAVKDGLTFKIQGSPHYNAIEIVLNSKDLYDFTFIKFNNKGIIKSTEVKDVHVESLHDTIEEHTKLYTYFKKRSISGAKINKVFYATHPDGTKMPPLDEGKLLMLVHSHTKNKKITNYADAVKQLKALGYKFSWGKSGGK